MSGISKQFGAVTALEDIELEVHAGEVVALVGDNGAGKSTLVKVLAGVHHETSGRIEYLGEEVTIENPRKALALGIATVYQDLSLCENLDVVANLFLGHELSPWRLDEVEMEVRAWTLLEELAARIPSVREPIASLSGGQRQTVAIARSLLEPEIIMLDEPTAALGVAQTAEVLNLIERVRDRGHGVILISHNMEDVRAVADRIVVLRLGRNNGVFLRHHRMRNLSPRSPAPPTTPFPGARHADSPLRPTGMMRIMENDRPKSHSSTAETHACVTTRESPAQSESSIDRTRSGDLGMLPVVVGLILISVVFTSLNPIFLAPINLANLLFDASAVGFIALGIIFVLLLGEIDLSVGSMSGLSSAMIGVLWVNRFALPLAILGALAAGAAVGLVFGLLRNRFDMPSFVATLAGAPHSGCNSTFSDQRVQLTCRSPPLVRFGQLMIMPTWFSYTLALLWGLAVIYVGVRRTSSQRSQPFDLRSHRRFREGSVLTAVLVFVVYYLDKGRGVPWMFAVFVVVVRCQLRADPHPMGSLNVRDRWQR